MAKESLSFKVNGISYSVKGMPGYSPLSFSSGYSSSGGDKGSAGTMRGYSFMKPLLYSQINLFPVPYWKIKDEVIERLSMYRKKCPKCGRESMSQGYNLN